MTWPAFVTLERVALPSQDEVSISLVPDHSKIEPLVVTERQLLERLDVLAKVNIEKLSRQVETLDDQLKRIREDLQGIQVLTFSDKCSKSL